MVKQLELTNATGAVAALAAVFAASCYMLPAALAGLGVSAGFIGLLEPLHAYRSLIASLTAVLLAAAWVMVAREPSARVHTILVVASALLILAYLSEALDPILKAHVT